MTCEGGEGRARGLESELAQKEGELNVMRLEVVGFEGLRSRVAELEAEG